MAGVPLILRPGINVQATPLLNESGYSSCQFIRFKDGLLQKLGGWAKLFNDLLTGVCRGIAVNQTLEGVQYAIFGTNERLEAFSSGQLYDITPLLAIDNLTNPFDTTMGDTEIIVTSVGSAAVEGNSIVIVTPASIGGIILQGYYEITSVIDADHYTIESATPATATVSGGGATALFTTTMGSPDVQVTLADHGLTAGDPYTVYVATTVGGLTIEGLYLVETVIDPDNFTILGPANAGSSDTDSENGGDVRINYLIAAGSVDAEPAQGYGLGYYGYGYYGYGTSSGALTPPREWTFAQWGEDMISCPINGSLYYFDSSFGFLNNPSTLIATAPDINTAVFTAMPQQQVVAIGAEVGGTQDPLLIRWSDVADYTDWVAVSDNQAGSFRLPRGSRIVGGMQGPQQALVWTDISMWIMQYIGPPYIYGFNEIGFGCGLIGARAMGVINAKLFWMGQNGFYMYDGGSVRSVPCTVWDFVFRNLNTAQSEKITCAPNSSFDEISWYFPTLSGEGEVDAYVKLNTADGSWDYGYLSRTAWIDQSVFGPPIGTSDTSYVYQHEVDEDADGVAMNSWAQTGWFQLDSAESFIFMERMIPDFILSTGATIKITVFTSDYPNGSPVFTHGPFSVTSGTPYVIVRARGRLASIKIESDDLNSFWRLGKIFYFGSQSGRR